jgi:hypothetical protein
MSIDLGIIGILVVLIIAFLVAYFVYKKTHKK